MDKKTTELIALGASTTANCVPCLQHHLAKAREAGATDGELNEAIRIGRMVRNGAAMKWDEEADAILDEFAE